MSIKSILVYLAILITFPTILHAQEQAGLRLERYAGINSIVLNPSFSASNPLKWDLRLAGMDLHIQNNYGFARNTSLFNLLNNLENVRLVTDTSSEAPKSGLPIILDFYGAERKNYAAINGRIDGPAFSIQVSNAMTIGFFTDFRFHADVYQIPSELAHTAYENTLYNTPVKVDPFRAEGMTWTEYGMNFAFKSHGKSDEPVHVLALSPKILRGHQAAFGSTRRKLDLMRLNKDSISFSNGNWEYGATEDLLSPDSIVASDFYRKVNGRGLGFDIGYSLLVPDYNSNVPTDYRLKIGFSMLDIGSMYFDKNSQDHALDFDSLTVVNTEQFSSINQVPDLITLISETFLQDSSASYRDDKMAMALPMAISFQVDAKIQPNFYLGGYWVQRVPLLDNALKRVNTLAFVPRYESRWFSASLPVVLHEYKRLQMGFAARLGYLTIGTDHLGSLFKKNHLYGANLYASLKINAFSFGSGGNGGLGKKGRSWDKVGCFEF